MSHIFISYSRKNHTYARQLADELLRRGFDVWIDDKIDYGDRWQRVIFKAIEDCAAIIILMSSESADSEWVEKEYTYAHRRKKAQFPVLLEGEEFPFYVTSHFVDVRDGTLPQENFYARLRQVVNPKDSRGVEIIEQSRTVQASDGTEYNSSGVIENGNSFKSDSQAATSLSPVIVKPDWVGSVLPEPFEWCFIPAGKVTLEPIGRGGDYLRKAQSFDVSDFWIGRYPITNSQFEEFVVAKDGWNDPVWWDFSQAAKAWRANNNKSTSSYFEHCHTCPREMVTWYAVVAFSRWLSAKIAGNIVLPTEQQWQRAAQGHDRRVFPWGNTWDSRKCNTSESKVGRTTPVTKYAEGTSPFGVYDLSGNVWEWTATDFTSGNSDLSNTNARVLRGGLWRGDPSLARVTYRYFNQPDFSNYSHGFRLAMLLT